MKADTSSIINDGLHNKLAMLYDNLEGMTDMLQTNFDQFNQALQKHHNDII